VGAEKKSFSIHKNLLCNAAPYFKAALDGGFAESKSQVLELPEDDVKVFERFILWLYTSELLQENETIKDVSWDVLVELYIFGEARGISGFQNEVVDTFIDKQEVTSFITTDRAPRIYENTPTDSPLRRLLVDWTACQGVFTREEYDSEQEDESLPRQFLFDVIFVLYDLKAGNRSTKFDFTASRSDYHVKSPVAKSDDSATEQ